MTDYEAGVIARRCINETKRRVPCACVSIRHDQFRNSGRYRRSLMFLDTVFHLTLDQEKLTPKDRKLVEAKASEIWPCVFKKFRNDLLSK